MREACAAPQSGSKPRKCRFRDEIQLLPIGDPSTGNGGPLGTVSPSFLFPGTSAPTTPSLGSRCSLQARTGAAPGPWALQKPQLVHRCSLHRVTWGRGGYSAETGTLLPLSPPAPPELSLRLRLLCGTRSAGPRSRLLSAPLTATMPPSALRSAVTLPPPPAAPHATAERWSRQGGARRAGSERWVAGPIAAPGQEPGREQVGGPRPRATKQRAGPQAAPGSGARRKVARALSWAGWICFVCSLWRENA